ncbi:hypothetical protein B0T26DRAFT_639809 [Lasiosphaeria miniovina]|uniref:Uncharacterized protein n=1 Tax=Lasiosphaeria miniovina TaxID=1954250 RepID=A0AA40E7P0_9PEZI|nr:uncharacterized protein B0T26DRAFT_639809 [Lasiosphaeria miniovina]KAK0728122.1 hypothetical protein B0T26DRAFT_639809 [Lasiosphaeria miniovina]
MSPFHSLLDGGVSWLESRGATGVVLNGNVTGTGNGFFQAANNVTTTQQMFFNELKFAAAKSIRTSTIILAGFNTVAAFATAMGILLDAYYRERRNNRQFNIRFVPEGDVFPLVLSFGIVIQSITFAVAQSTGLDTLVGLGCTMMAQLMLPAVFVAPYTQLVFGIETAVRALRKDPFAPRGKWTVSICLAIIGILVLANFLVADFDQSPNFCLTSLFWFVAHYSVGCFALLTGIVSSLIICLVVIFVRLHRSIKVEVTARVAASRMVYYLALAIISSGFMIPYFYAMAFISQRGGNGTHLTLSMVASVVANVSGLMTGGLYLFLKSNTLSTIGPRDKVGEYEKRKLKYKIRLADSNDVDRDNGSDSHMMHRVTGLGSLRRTDSDASLVSAEKVEDIQDDNQSLASTTFSGRNPNPLRSNAIYPTPGMPKAPEPAQFSSMASAMGHVRKRSYSLFPNNSPAAKSSLTLLPATTYSPNTKESAADSLKPPPSMRNLVFGRHRRDSSLVSSATVQIGLRFSSVEDIPPVVTSTAAAADSHVYDLECPLVQKEKEAAAQKRPAALDISPASTPTLEEYDDDTPKRDPVKDARMKTLPPVPRRNTAPPVDEGQTLSPSIYSPSSPTKLKLPSPRGVGFSMPVAKPNNGGSPSSPPLPTPVRRATDDSGPKPAKSKGDWI